MPVNTALQLHLVNSDVIKMKVTLHFLIMKKAFKNISIKFILVILALQILNMSISCRIADDSFFSQLDASVNIADHAVEFIVEVVLGHTNAFPELKENKQQHSLSCSQKVQEFAIYVFGSKTLSNNYPILTAENYHTLIVYPYNKFLQKITPPPKPFS